MPNTAAPAGPPQPNDNSRLLLYAGVGLFVVAFSIPAVIGFTIFYFARNQLRRRDWLILAVGCVATIALWPGLVADHLHWMKTLAFGDGNRLAVPVMSEIVLGGVVAALVGLLVGTSLAAKIPFLNRKESLGGRPDLIPSERERQSISIVAPPVLVADSSVHSVKAPVQGPRAFPVGVDRYGKPVVISEKEIETHGLIFGATGSGKSVTIQVIAAGLMDLGWSGMLIDLKEDTKPGGLRDWCNDYAAHHALPYQELRLSDPDPLCWFNPLAGLSQDEARDAILSLTRFDDEYYKNVCKAVLGQLLKLMYTAHACDPVNCPFPTIGEIARILGSASLPAATKKLRAIVASHHPTFDDNEFHTLARPQKVEQDQAASWGYKLGNVMTTQAGALVLSPDPGRRMLEVTQDGLIYVGLDSQGKQDLTKMVSSAMLQRLSADAAQRTTGMAKASTKRRFLIVDEANWVDRTIVQNLLSRARSAGISMILCTQGPMDWIDKDGNDFAKLAQNTNVAIFMRQGEPESAALCAEYIGKERFMQLTYSQRDDELMNSGSVREVEDLVVTPDQLRNLRIGEMVLKVGAPEPRSLWVKVIQRAAQVGLATPQRPPRQ